MTWGEITSTPVSLDTKPSPFRIAELSEREKLARKLAEKAQKDITSRQRAYTPRLRQGTTTLGKSGVPKFMSSPDVRKGLLTPVGQRLATGKRERESAAQVSSGIVGRTPLMRTPC